MNAVSFDSLTRDRARGISRRVSLGMVGAAGLATLASHLTGKARQRGKKRKDKKNDVNKKADQKCAAQADQCLDLFSGECDGDQECLVKALQCCPLVGECDVVGFFLCQSDVSV